MTDIPQGDPADDEVPVGQQLIGRVVEMLPNRQLRVALGRDQEVVAHLAGAMRVGVVRLLRGDLVRVERSPFDGRRARIVGRATDDEREARS